jgi:hypothetical protein
MTTHNPDNERIKRRYFAYLKEAKRHSEPTVDAVAKALRISKRGASSMPANRDLFIENILPEAREFWGKMEVRYEPGRFGEDGYLSRDSYERARSRLSDDEGGQGLVFRRRSWDAQR